MDESSQKTSYKTEESLFNIAFGLGEVSCYHRL